MLFENGIPEALVIGWREKWCGAAEEHVGKNGSAGVLEEVMMTLARLSWSSNGDPRWG